jgi:hypothetical protein
LCCGKRDTCVNTLRLPDLTSVHQVGGPWAWHLPPSFGDGERQQVTSNSGGSSGALTPVSGTTGLYVLQISTAFGGKTSHSFSRPFYLVNPTLAVPTHLPLDPSKNKTIQFNLVAALQVNKPPPIQSLASGSINVTAGSYFPVGLYQMYVNPVRDPSAPLATITRGCASTSVQVRNKVFLQGERPSILATPRAHGLVPCSFLLGSSNGSNILSSDVPLCPMNVTLGSNGPYDAVVYCDGVPSAPIPFTVDFKGKPLTSQVPSSAHV